MAKHETFKVPAAVGERFYFRVPGEDRDRSLPLMTSLQARVRHRLASIASRVAAADTPEEKAAVGLEAEDLQHDMVEEECPGLLDVVTGDQLDAIIAAWGRPWGGATPGE